jgi:hypothetical protein
LSEVKPDIKYSAYITKRLDYLKLKLQRLKTEAKNAMKVTYQQESEHTFFQDLSKVEEVFNKLKDGSLFITQAYLDEDSIADKMEGRFIEEERRMFVWECYVFAVVFDDV